MIDIVNNKYFLNNKKFHILTIWLMMLIILFLIFLNLFFNYKYKKYDEYLGYIKKVDSSYNLVIYVLEDNISEIYKYRLLVDGLMYDFSISGISDSYYIIDNNNYYEVILEVKLDKKLLIDNNIVNVVFEKNYTTLYKQFKKGLERWLS